MRERCRAAVTARMRSIRVNVVTDLGVRAPILQGRRHRDSSTASAGRPCVVFEPDRFYFDCRHAHVSASAARVRCFSMSILNAHTLPGGYPFTSRVTPAGWRDPSNEMPGGQRIIYAEAMSERGLCGILAASSAASGRGILNVRYAPIISRTLQDADRSHRRVGAWRAPECVSRCALTQDLLCESMPSTSRGGARARTLDVLDAPYLPRIGRSAAGIRCR